MTGVLNIRPLEAKLTHDTEFFGKMDPYCIVLIGSEKVRGKTCHRGGKHPTWQDVITVHRKGEPTLYIEFMDEDVGKDDIIGVSQINLDEIPSKSTNWYPVYYKQKHAGEVHLELVWTPVAPTGEDQHEEHAKHHENHGHHHHGHHHHHKHHHSPHHGHHGHHKH